MGLIHIELFATLDLVGQAPGGPDEDPVGFPFGGWQAPLLDEVAEAQVGAAYQGTDALLLGRRTYDIFAAYWPYQEGSEDNEIATLFNRYAGDRVKGFGKRIVKRIGSGDVSDGQEASSPSRVSRPSKIFWRPSCPSS